MSATLAEKISIVTPSFNQSQYLEQTIESVLSQGYPNLEYIIIDGGSTDESAEIIKKYAKYLKYWVSEKDRGQAHAINKGLQRCTGEIFNWLNSDDYLEPGALVKIGDAFRGKEVNMLAGKVRIFSDTTEEIIQNQELSAEGLMCWRPNVKFVQPGVWVRRKLVKESGGIDEAFHYAFDWDMYIRYLYFFANVKEIDEVLVHFRLHGGSKTSSLAAKFLAEEAEIIKKIRGLPAFEKLHNACDYKVEKAAFTHFLVTESKKESSMGSKLFNVLRSLPSYKRTAFSRQTAGAIKAILQKKEIS